jgi:hypothetical protein
MKNPIHPGTGEGLSSGARKNQFTANGHGTAISSLYREKSMDVIGEMTNVLANEAVAAQIEASLSRNPEGGEAIQLLTQKESAGCSLTASQEPREAILARLDLV